LRAWEIGLSGVQASGTSMALAMGRSRSARTMSSKTASRAAESELPGTTTGFTSSIASPKASAARRHSWAFIQLTLPRRVLISPLWAMTRNGWASHQVGKVLVE
jgi:hypothetical protein